MGASIVLHGGDLYAKSTPHPYTYPPFSALLFVPLALLPPDAMAIAWTVLSLAAFIVVTWISLGRLGVAQDDRLALTAIVCVAAVWLDPIADTLLAGQVNLIVIALVLADLLLPDTHRWKGIGVGFAASFKLLPLFFVVYLLVTRRIAAAVRAIASFFATVLIGLLVLPRDSLTFWSGTFLDSTRVGAAQNPRSESLLSLLVRWSHSATGVRPLWLALEVVVAIGILALALWAHRRGDEFLAILVAAAGPLLLSPITWRHHWVWILPMLLWMIRFALPPPLAGEPQMSGSRDFPRGQGPGPPAHASRRGVAPREPRSSAMRAFETSERAMRAFEASGGGLRWLWIPLVLIAMDFYLRPYGGIPVNALTDLHLDLGQLILSSTHPVSLLLFLASAIAILRGSREVGSSSTRRRRRQPSPEVRPART